jgi:hypothetical protein
LKTSKKAAEYNSCQWQILFFSTVEGNQEGPEQVPNQTFDEGRLK